MSWKPALPRERWHEIENLYKSGLSMQSVANRLRISLNAVTYVLRKRTVPRRSFVEANRLVFEAKPMSFSVKRAMIEKDRALHLAGALLYWAEGYKTDKATGLDFANSDPDMALLFMRFLRCRYSLDSKRLYCQVYYYADQDIAAITSFWSKKLKLPPTSFRYPYKKVNFKPGGKKLPYGVVHIRYTDKKLLRDVMNLIQFYRDKYCVGG